VWCERVKMCDKCAQMLCALVQLLLGGTTPLPPGPPPKCQLHPTSYPKPSQLSSPQSHPPTNHQCFGTQSVFSSFGAPNLLNDSLCRTQWSKSTSCTSMVSGLTPTPQTSGSMCIIPPPRSSFPRLLTQTIVVVSNHQPLPGAKRRCN